MKSTEFMNEAVVKPYKFKEYNSETQRDIKKIMDLLNANCTESLSLLKTPLWRGIDNHSAAVVHIKPQTGLRKSETTSNHYIELLVNNPYYKGWPKRDRAAICSTSRLSSLGFGNETYAIFPFNGVKIAVCPEDDIWHVNIRMPTLKNERYFELFNSFIRKNFSLPETYAEMAKFVKTPMFSSRLDEYNTRYKISDPLQPKQFLPYLHQCMSPASLGMKLMSIAEFAEARASGQYQNKECWFSGDAIAISSPLYYEFLDGAVKSNEIG